MALSANGSTVTFATNSIGDLTSISFSDGANEIDVTNLGDAVHVFESGIPSLEVTLEVNGSPSVDRGDTGAISISWNDGGSDGSGVTTWLCTNRESSGGVDEAITTSLTFVPFAGT